MGNGYVDTPFFLLFLPIYPFTHQLSTYLSSYSSMHHSVLFFCPRLFSPYTILCILLSHSLPAFAHISGPRPSHTCVYMQQYIRRRKCSTSFDVVTVLGRLMLLDNYFNVMLFFCLAGSRKSGAGLDWAGLGWAGTWRISTHPSYLGVGLERSGPTLRTFTYIHVPCCHVTSH